MRTIWANGSARVGFVLWGLIILVAAFGPFFIQTVLGVNPNAIDYNALGTPPSADHIFGTTASGQDVFAQFIVGSQSSVIVGVGVGLLVTVIALVIGVTGAYTGGWVDSLLNGVTNVALTLAGLPLLIVITSYLPGAGIVGIIIVISLVSWPGGARQIRAQVLSIRSRDFVTSARMVGESRFRLIFVEVVPHLYPLLASQLLGGIGTGILAQAALGFLGLTSGSDSSWGVMIGQVQQNGAITRGMWWWFIPPGLGLILIGVASVLINFGVDALSNPRLRNLRMTRSERQLLKAGGVL